MNKRLFRTLSLTCAFSYKIQVMLLKVSLSCNNSVVSAHTKGKRLLPELRRQHPGQSADREQEHGPASPGLGWNRDAPPNLGKLLRL